MKNEKEKNSLKELYYLKKISLVEEKLNYYESTINKKNNNKNFNDIDRNISSAFIEKEKNMKEKFNNSLISKLDDLTIINNSCTMKRTNLFKNVPDYSKRTTFSINKSEFNDKKNIKIQILKKASKYFNNDDTFRDIIKSKYIFVKPRLKLNRVKSTS